MLAQLPPYLCTTAKHSSLLATPNAFQVSDVLHKGYYSRVCRRKAISVTPLTKSPSNRDRALIGQRRHSPCTPWLNTEMVLGWRPRFDWGNTERFFRSVVLSISAIPRTHPPSPTLPEPGLADRQPPMTKLLQLPYWYTVGYKGGSVDKLCALTESKDH